MRKTKRNARWLGRVICTALLAAALSMPVQAAAADIISVAYDENSVYGPTQIINGDFEAEMSGTGTKGTGTGWNTTDNKFERTRSMYIYKKNCSITGYFAEMNADNSAALYQDLETTPGDVMRWTLNHAAREDNLGYGGPWDSPQSMHVVIGAPQKSSSGSIIYPSGVNAALATNIVESTKADFASTGVTGGGSSYGYY